MYPHRCDMHEMDRPVGALVRKKNARLDVSQRQFSPRKEGQIVAAAEMQLLSEYVREMTGFRLEKLAAILEVYRDDCRRNDNVTGMQRAARNILALLGTTQPV